jgi:predicted secreted protein
MGWFEAIVVFVMSWWLVFLPILSWRTRSQQDAGAVVPGSDRGAPEAPGLRLKAMIATGVAAGVTVFVWAGLFFGWFESWIPQTYQP